MSVYRGIARTPNRVARPQRAWIAPRALALGTVAVFALGWLGILIPPRPFPAPGAMRTTPKTMPLPTGLPPPVERFYRTVYGERVPVIDSAIVSGRARLRPVGRIMLPARFRFLYEAGRGYRHHIEVTLFGIPVMTVDERFVDGRGVMSLPFGVEQGDAIDQAANLGLWAETIWFPSVYLTDPRVRWEPVDAHTAVLITPAAGSASERIIVRFDEQTGLIVWFESMRHRGAASASKMLWLNRIAAWRERDGRPFAATGEAIWMDDGKPWAIFDVEDIVYNADVTQRLRGRGP
jgi:hypothetical protein